MTNIWISLRPHHTVGHALTPPPTASSPAFGHPTLNCRLTHVSGSLTECHADLIRCHAITCTLSKWVCTATHHDHADVFIALSQVAIAALMLFMVQASYSRCCRRTSYMLLPATPYCKSNRRAVLLTPASTKAVSLYACLLQQLRLAAARCPAAQTLFASYF